MLRTSVSSLPPPVDLSEIATVTANIYAIQKILLSRVRDFTSKLLKCVINKGMDS